MALTTEPFISSYTFGDSAISSSDRPVVSAVDFARQSFVQEPLSPPPQADIFKSFLEQAAQERIEDSPAFQQRQQAIESIRQTNPGFLSRRLQQATSANVEQSKPKFTNILEEIETDPVQNLQQTTTPSDFVQTFKKEEDELGFDEEDAPEPTGSFGDLFGEEEESAFGDFSGAQMSGATQAVESIAFDPGPSLSLFGGDPIDTPQEAAAKGKLAEAARFVDVELAIPLALATEKANLFAPETIVTQIGKEVVTGVIMGANPSLAAPLGGIPFVTPAGLIVGGVFSGIGAAADIANSSYSGFGFGNFASAFLNNLTFGIFGDSIEDQENEQEEDDLLVESIISLGQKGEFNFGNLEPPTTSEKDILNMIEGARRSVVYGEKELDLPPGGETSVTSVTSLATPAHSFGNPYGTPYDDTSEIGPPSGPTGPGGIGSVADNAANIGMEDEDEDDDNNGDGNGNGNGDGDGDGDGDGGGTACWVAGTQILMADNTYRNIEDLKIGDMVMSYPETKKTRRWNTPLEAKPIISLLVDVHPEIWHLNDSMVSGTEWMIKSDGTAAIVQWLNVGDTVLGPDNNLVEITRVEPAEGQLKKQVIYNFETENNYTYIADGMRTIRGRAVRGEYAPSAGRVHQVIQTYLSGDTNSYEGSMKDEYVRKFDTIKNAA